MALTPTVIVNRAANLQGNKVPEVTGTYPTFDDSATGKAARWLYDEAVKTVGALFEWDFARFTDVLALSGNVAPDPWLYEYLYPTGALQVWQVKPATQVDPNYPIPTTWSMANAVVSGTQVSVLRTNVPNAVAVYNNNPGPDTWQPAFTDAVVRWLSSAFSMALSGRPETQANILTTATTMLQQAMGRES